MKRYATLFLVFSLVFLAAPAGVFAQSAVLSLAPSSGTFNKGCSFSVAVNLDTGGAETDGADAILIYDTTRFNATSITNGTAYPDYPGNNIDAQSGKITISGLASVNTPFTGKGLLATINFTVQNEAPTGATQVTFDFDAKDKGKTTDSNVVQRVTVVDVLNSVTNGSYTIGSGSCVQASSSPVGNVVQLPATGGPATPSANFIPMKTLPEGGTFELTSTLAIIGGMFTILGILGLALL